MAVAPLNKFITLAVPVAPGEQIIYEPAAGINAIVLYAQVANVAGVTTYPTVTLTHRRTSRVQRTFGNRRNIRIIKNAEVPPNDSLVIIDGRLILERSALIEDSLVISGTQSGITTISGCLYDSTTGIATVTTLSNHGFSVGSEITMIGLAFTCPPGSAVNSKYIFPDPQASFTVIETLNPTTFVADVGVAIGITHTFIPAIHKFISSKRNSVVGVAASFTPTNAEFEGATGVLKLTIPSHGLGVGSTIRINDNSLTFTCSSDGFFKKQTYPRPTDPAGSGSLVNTVGINTFGVLVVQSVVGVNTFSVNVGPSTSGGQVGPLQMEFICSILENSIV